MPAVSEIGSANVLESRNVTGQLHMSNSCSSRFSPIAVFAYNRPDHLEAMFNSLRGCEGFENSDITIFVDGSRSERDKPKVEAVRAFVADLNLANVSHVFQDRNQGLKESISQGVSALCSQHGRVIVLEDDLDFSPDVLLYFNEALDKYRNYQQVWSVCADMPDISDFKQRQQCLFLPTGNSWGWATWDRAWRHFSLNTPLDRRWFNSNTFKQRFGVHGLRDFPAMLRQATEGRVDSWFIFWNFAIIRHNGLSVYPPRPLILNRGLTAGTHGSFYNLFAIFPLEKNLGSFDFTLPDDPIVDFCALDAIVASPEWRMLRLNSVLGAAKRRLKWAK